MVKVPNPPPDKQKEARIKAWKTRRQKYGAHGHRGIGRSYSSRRPGIAMLEERCARMENFIIKMLYTGEVSEGQAASATGLHRIELRRRVDLLRMQHGEKEE